MTKKTVDHYTNIIDHEGLGEIRTRPANKIPVRVIREISKLGETSPEASFTIIDAVVHPDDLDKVYDLDAEAFGAFVEQWGKDEGAEIPKS